MSTIHTETMLPSWITELTNNFRSIVDNWEKILISEDLHTTCTAHTRQTYKADLPFWPLAERMISSFVVRSSSLCLKQPGYDPMSPSFENVVVPTSSHPQAPLLPTLRLQLASTFDPKVQMSLKILYQGVDLPSPAVAGVHVGWEWHMGDCGKDKTRMGTKRMRSEGSSRLYSHCGRLKTWSWNSIEVSSIPPLSQSACCQNL